MTTAISSLQWKPYQGAQGGSLIANVALDSAVDTAFNVPMSAPYSNQNPMYADGVIIDNTQNNGIVTVVAGPLTTTISQFSRDFVALDKNIGGTILVLFTVGQVNLLFYNGTPPINPSLTNYGGALASVNAIGFTGGLDTGSASGRSITVSSNYAFGNGTLLSFTSHAINFGPATLRVNGLPPVAITKITPNGSVPLTGFELGINTSVVLACNATTGTFDIVSDFKTLNVLTTFLSSTPAVPTSPTWGIPPSLVILGGTAFNVGDTWQFDAQMTFLNNGGLADQISFRIADFSTGLVTYVNGSAVPFAGASTRTTYYLSCTLVLTAAQISGGFAVGATSNSGGANTFWATNSFFGTAGLATFFRATRIG